MPAEEQLIKHHKEPHNMVPQKENDSVPATKFKVMEYSI